MVGSAGSLAWLALADRLRGADSWRRGEKPRESVLPSNPGPRRGTDWVIEMEVRGCEESVVIIRPRSGFKTMVGLTASSMHLIVSIPLLPDLRRLGVMTAQPERGLVQADFPLAGRVDRVK
jgi:hypothetical protein